MNVFAINFVCQVWGDFSKTWATCAVIKEVFKPDQRATFIDFTLLCASSNPVYLAVNQIRLSFSADTTDANNGIEIPFANAPHAILNAKPTFVRVAGVG